MHIRRLRIQDFRCFSYLEWMPAPGLNILTGPNGIGKTSILEAVFFLSSGKSFRNGSARHIIRQKQDQLCLHGVCEEQDRLYELALCKEKQGSMRTQIQGKPARGIIPLSVLLPVVAIHSKSYFLIDGGPLEKRRFMDWLVFHVKPEHLVHWRKYQHILTQTNALLKKKQNTRDERVLWYQQLALIGEQLDENRRSVYRLLEEKLRIALAQPWNESLDIKMNYYCGWKGGDLLTQLVQQDEVNQKYGSVLSGPQRMDLKITARGVPAEKHLSRGQKKILAIQLYLEQIRLIFEQTEKLPVVCLDDLDSELDRKRISFILSALGKMNVQVFASSLHPDVLFNDYPGEEKKVFHVEHLLE